jgi:predicted DNA-binding transcriptional regulator AlpA
VTEPYAAPEPYVAPETVVAFLELKSVRVLYGWNYEGDGPPAYKIGKHLRYRLSEVDEWAEAKRASR